MASTPLSKMVTPSVIKEGLLGYRAKWFIKRYIVLTPISLVVYDNERDKIRKKSRENIRVEDLEDPESSPGSFSFQVQVQNKLMYFRASNEMEKQEWMTAFSMVVALRDNSIQSYLHTSCDDSDGAESNLHRNTWSEERHSRAPQKLKTVQSFSSTRPVLPRSDKDNSLSDYKLCDEQINQECSEKHLLALSSSGNFIWREWSTQLGLSEEQIIDIENSDSPNAKALDKWHNRLGFTASYRKLIEMFEDGANVLLSEEVCRLLRAEPHHLTKHYKIKETQLEVEVSDHHLLKLTQSGKFLWRDWVDLLGLSDQQIKDLEVSVSLDDEEKAHKVLKLWHDNNGFKATYMRLVCTFLEAGSGKLAGEVCKLLKACECSPLQNTFLDELRNQLKVIRTFSSAELRYTSTQKVVDEYVMKIISSGFTSLTHLHEHIDQLYSTEKILDYSDIVEKAKEKSHRVFSLRKSTLLKSSKPSTHYLEEKTTKRLSRRLVYHACICSQAVIRCTVDTCQQFFEGEESHTLEEVSLSNFSQERYLIAREKDSTYYIAFQSDPDIGEWIRNFKSFHEGIVNQAKVFPIHFILELLRKHRVVLTGFSFGGLLACYVTSQVWLSRHLSSRHLQENLACVTFAQPHIPVPLLSDVAKDWPEVTGTLHAIYNENDPVPRLMKFLDIPLNSVIKKNRRPPPPFEDPMTLRLAIEIRRFIEQGKALDSHSQLSFELHAVLKIFSEMKPNESKLVMTYYLSSLDQFEKMSAADVSKNTSFPKPATQTTFNFSEHLVESYMKIIMKTCLHNPPPPVCTLIPSVTRLELCNLGSEFTLTVLGTNLSFCDQLFISGTIFPFPLHCISGNSIQVHFKLPSPELNSLTDGQNVKVGCQTIFAPCVKKEVPFSSKTFQTSIRQGQLAKLTPSQIIELSYLCALLEQQQQQCEGSKPFSNKVDAIVNFLKKIVDIVPVESIGYAMAYGNLYVAKQCKKAIEVSSLDLSSMLMSDSMAAASQRFAVSLLFTASDVPTSVVCGLNLQILYPITTNIKGLRSPIDILQSSRYALSTLSPKHQPASLDTDFFIDPRVDYHSFIHSSPPSLKSSPESSLIRLRTQLSDSSSLSISPNSIENQTYSLVSSTPENVSHAIPSLNSPTSQAISTSHGNSHMLHIVNKIKQEDLAVCTSLIVGFMDQEEICIPLVRTGGNQSRIDSFNVDVWALSNLGRSEVDELLAEKSNHSIGIRVCDFASKSQVIRPESLHDGKYAGKLHFMVQCLQTTVPYNTQHICYSLERQLVNLCQERTITNSTCLEELINMWDTFFEGDVLCLVATSHRALVGRWLKWSLMVHDLREELAKYTAIGVIGLVNSGKSGLVSSLFGVQVSSGTTEDKRTTVPLIYNLNDEMEGLNVVDFPGVDDRDESISELADLFLALAQIIIFVVDYRRVHTVSSLKWLKRLQSENVPLLICLSYGDKFYAEHMSEDGDHPNSALMINEVHVESSRIREKLELPEEQVIMLCSFKQDVDSVLNSDAGRQILRGVGIMTHVQVGDWLIQTLDKELGEKKLASVLHKVFHPRQTMVRTHSNHEDVSISDTPDFVAPGRSASLPLKLLPAGLTTRLKKISPDIFMEGGNEVTKVVKVANQQDGLTLTPYENSDKRFDPTEEVCQPIQCPVVMNKTDTILFSEQDKTDMILFSEQDKTDQTLYPDQDNTDQNKTDMILFSEQDKTGPILVPEQDRANQTLSPEQDRTDQTLVSDQDEAGPILVPHQDRTNQILNQDQLESRSLTALSVTKQTNSLDKVPLTRAATVRLPMLYRSSRVIHRRVSKYPLNYSSSWRTIENHSNLMWVKVRQVLLDLRSMWYTFGVELGVDESILEEIKQEHRGDLVCYFQLIGKLSNRQTDPLSLEQLISALNSPSIGRSDLADQIRDIHQM